MTAIKSKYKKRYGSLILVLTLAGCAPKAPLAAENFTEKAMAEAETAEELCYEADPETFSLKLRKGSAEVTASLPGEKRRAERVAQNGAEMSWEYPEEEITVDIRPEADYLRVTITSEAAEDNEFLWPSVSGETYYMPFGEGKRIPGDDKVWSSYLRGTEFSALEQLSMPFWAAVDGDYAVLFIMENPYRSDLVFSETSPVSFGLRHRYPQIDPRKENSFRIYMTSNDPTAVAKVYRSYAASEGRLVTLEEKARQNPEIEKLYGAPHIYLWGERLIAPEDVNWSAFRRSLDTEAVRRVAALAGRGEDKTEAESVLKAVASQDYVDNYQKNVICRVLSEAMMQPDFYSSGAFPERDGQMEELLREGAENLGAAQVIQLNKRALAANMPGVFRPVEEWQEEETTGLIKDMKAAGIGRAWIGLNSWEQAYAKPELVSAAVSAGYLIGPYDSYHSIHEPGKEQWITAKFPDSSLYEKATVTKRSGEKEAGFQNVGRKLNPVLALPSVKQRVEEVLSTGVPFNSWFIDCDATGEVYDDYTEEHVTTQQEDLIARLERMAYIRDQHRMVVGSEGGNDFAASVIAFAHGIELRSFSWMDPDMKSNRDSEYYIGRYYSPTGGVAEHFSKVVPVKAEYYHVFVDPRYDLPLYKLVYNDSVITGYHWDWSTFKIQEAAGDRMLREILYNTPPLYHLDRAEWEKYREAITSHTAIWSQFNEQALRREMTDFENLREDGSVQMTRYGEDLSVTANFGREPYGAGDQEIPPHSLVIEMEGVRNVYTPEQDF